MKRPRVAIDGPAGAGKSTVARRLAQHLGFLHVDTGALYRTVALAAERAGAAWDDEPRVALVAAGLVREERIRLAQGEGEEGSGMKVLLDSEDVSGAIRTPAMSLGASRVSAIPDVRAALLALQRMAGREGGVVLEGRDIGTVVFPDAEVKFYLTASVDARAERRYKELVAKGQEADLARTREEVVGRDRADTERKIAPLRQAEDAILVDSTDRPVEDVIEEMARVVLDRQAQA